MDCPLCGCEGRVAHAAEVPGGAEVDYLCANPRCGNHKRVFGTETLMAQANEEEEDAG